MEAVGARHPVRQRLAITVPSAGAAAAQALRRDQGRCRNEKATITELRRARLIAVCASTIDASTLRSESGGRQPSQGCDLLHEIVAIIEHDAAIAR